MAQVSGADEKVVVMVPAALDPTAPIGDAVKRECAVDTSVGTQVFQRVSERYPGTEQINNPNLAAPDKTFLKVTLIGVLGHGGGSWSGPKSITIRAEVLRGSKLIATQTLSRQSGGGVFGGVSGTCAIMDRIAAALGRDVAQWLPAALMVIKYDAQAKEAAAATPATADKPVTEQKQ
jgi:hypothetical protein